MQPISGRHAQVREACRDVDEIQFAQRTAREIIGQVLRRPSAEELEVAKDGSLTVTRPLSDHGWALRHVLQYGAEAEVIEPESVREEIRVALRRVVRER